MIDVCVVTYRNEDSIRDCVVSAATVIPGSRVLVRDNSPDSATRAVVQALADEGHPVEVLSATGNIGFGAACNELAAAATSDTLVFLNPDAEVLTWDDAVVTDNPGLVGAHVFLPDGSTQITFGPQRTVAEEARIRVLRRPRSITLATDRPRTEVAFVSGAAFAIRREDFLRIGGFDAERYFMYYEDIDLGRRVAQAGGRVEVDNRWTVRHVGGLSAKKAHATALQRSYVSAARYHRRWSTGWPLFRPLTLVEGLLKLGLSLPSGHIGQTDRSTQQDFVRFLATRAGRAQVQPPVDGRAADPATLDAPADSMAPRASSDLPAPQVPAAVSRERTAAALVLFHPDEAVRARIDLALANCAIVYVVDNTPAGQATIILPEGGSVVLLAAGTNLGLGAAYNRCFERAQADGFDWVVTLDQDTDLHADYLTRLAAELEAAPSALAGDPHRAIGVVGPAFINPALPDQVEHRHGDLVAVEAVVSSGSLTSVDCWRATGGFDEKLFIDFVDTQFCLRAGAAGYAVVSVGVPLMTHGMGNTRKQSILRGRYSRMTSSYPPLRHYYIARNAILTARTPGVPVADWARREAVRRAKFTALSLLMEPGRGAIAAATLRGIADGLRGRGGAR